VMEIPALSSRNAASQYFRHGTLWQVKEAERRAEMMSEDLNGKPEDIKAKMVRALILLSAPAAAGACRFCLVRTLPQAPVLVL
jgi:hypothetical protein